MDFNAAVRTPPLEALIPPERLVTEVELTSSLTGLLRRFEELTEEEPASIESLRDLNLSRRMLISSVLKADYCKLMQTVFQDLLEARKQLVLGVCAVGNPDVQIKGFEGIHEEMCMFAFVNFLKEVGIHSSGWSAASIEKLTSSFMDLLNSSFELKSCSFNEFGSEVLITVISERLTNAMQAIASWSESDYMLLPGGWSGDDITGHFFFVMVSKCHRAAHYSLKLFDTQPCLKRGAEKVEDGWRVKLYVEREMDSNKLKELIGQVLHIRTASIDDEVTGEKICEIVYYPQNRDQKVREVHVADTVTISGENGCVADSLYAFLRHWEDREKRNSGSEGGSLFSDFQTYLWNRYHGDIQDPYVYKSLLLAMQRIELKKAEKVRVQSYGIHC